MEPSQSIKSVRSRSAEKTAAILEGAIRVFLEQGYVGTTMDRVAIAAGVSKPTLYSHFQDKEGLFNALTAQWVQKTEWATRPQDLLKSQESPQIVLRQLANNILDSCIDHPEKITFIRMILGESGRFPELGKAFVQHMDKPVLDALTQYLEDSPSLNLSDPAASAHTFMGTLIFFLMSQQMLHGQDIVPMDRDRLVENLISLMS
jgi:AcrR family transcriptional regulator